MHRMFNESVPDGRVDTLENHAAMAALYFMCDSVGQVHETLRRALDRNRALWGGFVLVAAGARILSPATPRLPASSATSGNGSVRSMWRFCRSAPTNRWFMQRVHMNPAEAVQAHLDLDAAERVGMHVGTFPLTTEAIDEPLRALDDACRASHVAPSRFPDAWFRRIGAAAIIWPRG
jgi:L-ascorbate metabolism protein UlaG (beta-lactamase superfamily)